MAHNKRLKAGYETFDRTKSYTLDEAITLAKSNSRAKFDETIEFTMNLGIDPRHADQMVRGLLSLPNGTGKVLRVGVFARGAKAEEALAAGADIVGAEDLAEKVQGGEFAFDRCIATPDMMALVGRVTTSQLREIAETKMKDMNANEIEAAMRMLAGSARSMGLSVVEG